MTLTGSTVNTWKDKSGNGYNFTQSSYSTTLPPLSNLTIGKGVYFGSLQGLYNVLFPFPTTYTIFCVANQTTNSGAYQYILHSPYNADFTIFFGSSNGNFATFAGSASAWNDITANSPTSAIATTTNTASLLCCTNNGTTLTPYFNGTALTTKTGTNVFAAGLTLGDTSTAQPRQPWQGTIGEIIIYNAVLTTAQRQKVEGYLAQKWRLQNLLISTSPYKLYSPSQESILSITPTTIATVTLSALSSSSGTITWTTSTNAVGYYWYIGTTAGTPLQAGVVGAVLTTAVTYSFIVSTNYYAWVIPFSSTGRNAATTTSTAASYVAAPGQATVNTPTNTTTTLNMTWNAPVSGGTVTGYTVQVLASGSAAPSGLLSVGNVLSTTFSPMVAGTPYSFYVTATGPGGSGTQSATSTTVTYTAPPVAPTSVVLSALTGTGATVTWSGGSGATSYNGQIYSSASAAMTSPTAVGSLITSITSPRAFTFTPTNGLYYGAIITAVNAGGSTASAISTGVLYSAASPPVAPTTVTIGTVSISGATVTWSGGSGALSYTVQIYSSYSPSMTSPATVTQTPLSSASLSASPQAFTFTAIPLVYYGAIVTAVNGSGSTASSISAGRMYLATFTVTTLAGNGLSTGDVDGTGTGASTKNPTGSGVNSAGDIYIADYGMKIRKVTTGGVVTTFAGSGATGNADGTGTAATFNFPTMLCIDSSDRIYVPSAGTTIRQITTGAVVTTVGTGFTNTKAVTVDNLGNAYNTDYATHRINKIVIAPKTSSVFAGSGVAGYANGTGTAAQFNIPLGIVTDKLGNMYVCDSTNRRIRKVTTGAVVSTLAGSGATGNLDGIGVNATFTGVQGIAIDPAGSNLYITDGTANRIRMIVLATTQVSTIAGSGVAGSASGIGNAATFNAPYGISMNPSGNTLYVNDGAGNYVRQIVLG